MATDKECSDSLADFTMADLKWSLKLTLNYFYLCHVGGVISMLLILTLFAFHQLIFATVLLPVVLLLNQIRKHRHDEAQIIKSAINYRIKFSS